MGKLKLYKWFFLNSKKKRVFYLIVGIFLFVLDISNTLIKNNQFLYITFFNWIFFCLYFTFSIFLCKRLPNRFINFIENNSNLFKNPDDVIKESRETFNNKTVTAIFFTTLAVVILLLFILGHDVNQLYLLTIVRKGDISFILIDILVLFLTIVFVSPILDLLMKLFPLTRYIGTKKFQININSSILRQEGLKKIGKWCIYGMGSIVVYQLPSLAYSFIMTSEGIAITVISSIISLIFLTLLFIFLYSTKHISSQIKNYKQQQTKTWLSQIQGEFSKHEPNYLKINALEISLSKLKETLNWPLGFNLKTIIIFVIPVMSIIMSIFQFII